MMPSLSKSREEVSSKVFSSSAQYAEFRLNNQNFHEGTVTFSEEPSLALTDVIDFPKAPFEPH